MRTTEEAIKQYKHICWYPSAGHDFRELLYISDWYYQKNNVPRDRGQKMPDLFILTDVLGLPEFYRYEYRYHRDDFCKPGFVLFDDRTQEHSTKITVVSFEELCDLDLSFKDDLSAANDNSLYNSSWLMEVEIESKISGVITKYKSTILYAAVQNEAFANEFLIPNKIKVEYQVLIRYGEGFGGANVKPTWILLAFQELGIRYVVSNDRYVEWAETEETDKTRPSFEKLYSIDGVQWSDYGEVGWYKVS